jgi:hypothetical protein
MGINTGSETGTIGTIAVVAERGSERDHQSKCGGGIRRFLIQKGRDYKPEVSKGQ